MADNSPRIEQLGGGEEKPSAAHQRHLPVKGGCCLAEGWSFLIRQEMGLQETREGLRAAEVQEVTAQVINVTQTPKKPSQRSQGQMQQSRRESSGLLPLSPGSAFAVSWDHRPGWSWVIQSHIREGGEGLGGAGRCQGRKRKGGVSLKKQREKKRKKCAF